MYTYICMYMENYYFQIKNKSRLSKDRLLFRKDYCKVRGMGRDYCNRQNIFDREISKHLQSSAKRDFLLQRGVNKAGKNHVGKVGWMKGQHKGTIDQRMFYPEASPVSGQRSLVEGWSKVQGPGGRREASPKSD